MHLRLLRWQERVSSDGADADLSPPLLLSVLPCSVGVLVALTEEEEQELSAIGQRLLDGCDDWYDRRRGTFLIDKREGRFDRILTIVPSETTMPGTPGETKGGRDR